MLKVFPEKIHFYKIFTDELSLFCNLFSILRKSVGDISSQEHELKSSDVTCCSKCMKVSDIRVESQKHPSLECGGAIKFYPEHDTKEILSLVREFFLFCFKSIGSFNWNLLFKDRRNFSNRSWLTKNLIYQ